MNEQLHVLQTVAKRLDEAGVAYMVSGSTAMNHYAKPRMTRDIDIVVELRAGDVPRLVAVFESDFYVDPDMITDAIAGVGMFNFIHEPSVTKVDFIVRKDSEYRRTEFERRREITLGDTAVSIVSAEDLVLSKLVWSASSRSEMQRDDVRNLLAAADLDHPYLQRWAGELGVREALDEACP